MISAAESLLACLPPVAYDPGAPGVVAEAATAATLIDRLLNSAQRLLVEMDPALAADTLADWERIYGLPDQCSPLDLILAQRTALLMRKIASTGGQSKAYVIASVLAAGYVITIDTFDTHSVSEDVEHGLYDLTAPFLWRVNVTLPAGSLYTVESAVDEALETAANFILECLINEIKPAHTLVLFNYL